jgi:hypothetical protein
MENKPGPVRSGQIRRWRSCGRRVGTRLGGWMSWRWRRKDEFSGSVSGGSAGGVELNARLQGAGKTQDETGDAAMRTEMRSQTKVQRVMKMNRGTPRWEQNVFARHMDPPGSCGAAGMPAQGLQAQGGSGGADQRRASVQQQPGDANGPALEQWTRGILEPWAGCERPLASNISSHCLEHPWRRQGPRA